MKKNEKATKFQVMEGFNPKVYSRLSMLFGILTILNVAVVFYAFSITGYGLWHAEDALSYIAKVNSSFEKINENVLNVVIQEKNPEYVADNVRSIEEHHAEILANAEKFRGIDLSNIDKSVPPEFDTALSKIERYYTTVMPKLEAVRDGSGKASELQDPGSEALRKDASDTIAQLFEKQDASTYVFFCRIGQGFLLVPGFLIFTMSLGMFAISRSKKRDYQFARNLKSSQQKTDNLRQKAKAIAYTNVLTGLRNRYVFIDRLKECMANGYVNVALYSFNGFRSINATYGREMADELIIAASQKVLEQFATQAEIFSTESDELCVMFNQDIPTENASVIAKKILDLLSQPFQLQEHEIQLNVAGCFKLIPVNHEPSSSTLAEIFAEMDRSVNQAIGLCMTNNTSQLLQA